MVAYAPLLLLIPVRALGRDARGRRTSAVGLSCAQPAIKGIRSQATAIAGRVVLAVVALTALSGFLSAVIDIATEHT